jgi:hypothetical protein
VYKRGAVIEANIKEAGVDGISKREIYHNEAKAEDHGISEEEILIIIEGEQQTSIKYLSLRTKNHQFPYLCWWKLY